jgi:hypothetical protein
LSSPASPHGYTPGPEAIRELGQFAGLDIPEEDLIPLSRAMQQHLASIAALEQLDLTDIESPIIFRATWDE